MNPTTTKDYSAFRTRLTGLPLLADGGMGTELYSRGIYVNRCYDELNIVEPGIVGAIHADFLDAGAEIIESNTYGANRFKLNPFGLDEQVETINRLGAEIALEQVELHGGNAFVAGAIGPMGRRLAPLGRIEKSEARQAYSEQAQGLIDGGVDLIVIETMIDPMELVEAIRAVRELSNIPLIAQFTLSDWNETAYGATMERIVYEISGLSIDVIGINCSLGPNKLLEAAKRLMQLTDLPVAIQPNAGELEQLEGRMICRTTPEYFAEYAKRLAQNGVKIIGSCCGSTPAHTRAMSAALRAISSEIDSLDSVKVKHIPVASHSEVESIPYRDLSPMAEAIEDGRFVFSVEVNPPRSPAIGKLIAKVKELKAAGVELINIPDGPRASARLSAMILAYLIKQRVEIDPILHYTCRDRNILGMQSDLLGAEALKLDNILCVTGDPPKLGNYPMATAVYDVDAIGLLKIADNLNHGLDLAGNPIPRHATFHLGCGANPGSVDLAKEVDRLHQKIETGARFVLTQPVFDVDVFFNFLDKVNLPKLPVLAGILPLASYRNAEFFHNEVPGMEVPKSIRERLRAAENPEAAEAIGVEVASEALARCASRAAGAYIMPPFGKIQLALDVISRFKASDFGREKTLNKVSQPHRKD